MSFSSMNRQQQRRARERATSRSLSLEEPLFLWALVQFFLIVSGYLGGILMTGFVSVHFVWVSGF